MTPKEKLCVRYLRHSHHHHQRCPRRQQQKFVVPFLVGVEVVPGVFQSIKKYIYFPRFSGVGDWMKTTNQEEGVFALSPHLS